MSRTPFSNVNNKHVHSMIPEDQKNMTTQGCSTGRRFTAATQRLNLIWFNNEYPLFRKYMLKTLMVIFIWKLMLSPFDLYWQNQTLPSDTFYEKYKKMRKKPSPIYVHLVMCVFRRVLFCSCLRQFAKPLPCLLYLRNVFCEVFSLNNA